MMDCNPSEISEPSLSGMKDSIRDSVVHSIPAEASGGSSSVIDVSQQTFPQFSRLPTELRLKIWHHALPKTLGPAFFHFHQSLRELKGITCSSTSSRLDSLEQDNNSDNSDITVPSRPEKLDIPMHTPVMALVNRESHQAVMDWAKKQKPPIRQVVGQGLVRRFDPQYDALFIARWQERLFSFNNPGTPPFEPEWTKSRPEFRVPRLAVHERSMLSVGNGDFQLLNFHEGGVLYIICASEPPAKKDCREIGRSFGGVFIWNADEGRFNFESDGSMRLKGYMQFQDYSVFSDYAPDRLTYWERLKAVLDLLVQRLILAGSRADGYEVRPVELGDKAEYCQVQG
ncbi:hypothetical protein K461DRAFT_297908 [Myriangium duriaei CBS 260.36]|uniref:2EXR domain-containing protein n=1 Tax=Myriangium duriaei CBS 260.36 TaxID=1168546 RepID=A0A9P4MI44_9PEZI|nr:hypothetical protein K461DRAFT_297908 [Myriangium duriaei CBS 260.36]